MKYENLSHVSQSGFFVNHVLLYLADFEKCIFLASFHRHTGELSLAGFTVWLRKWLIHVFVVSILFL